MEQMRALDLLFSTNMNFLRSTLPCRALLGPAVAFVAATATRIDDATVWSGPLFAYTQPTPAPTQAANQDRITTNVWLTRASSKGLFNAFLETNATSVSPLGTEWAFGALTNYASLAFSNWSGLLNGQSPTTLVGQQMVVHLTADDIYVGIEITVWGSGGSGGFAYQRTTPEINLTGATVIGTQFSFDYTAGPGLEYLIESSSNLVDWIPLATNSPSGATASFSDTVNAAGPAFYRVGLIASP
jgi:hypothetical protein